MVDYELTFIIVLVGVVVLTCVFISQLNNTFAIILTLAGLAVFTFLIISQGFEGASRALSESLL